MKIMYIGLIMILVFLVGGVLGYNMAMNYDAHHRLYDGQDHNYYYKAIASDLSWLEQQFTPAMKPLNNSVAEITQEPLVYYCSDIASDIGQDIEHIGFGYALMGEDVYAQGKYVTSCSVPGTGGDVCKYHPEAPYVLYDGVHVYMKGQKLIGVEYTDIEVIDRNEQIISDGSNYYKFGELLTGEKLEKVIEMYLL